MTDRSIDQSDGRIFECDKSIIVAVSMGMEMPGIVVVQVITFAKFHDYGAYF